MPSELLVSLPLPAKHEIDSTLVCGTQHANGELEECWIEKKRPPQLNQAKVGVRPERFHPLACTEPITMTTTFSCRIRSFTQS